MKQFLFIFILFLSFAIHAQRPNNNAAAGGLGNGMKVGRLYGRIFDENKNAVPYATVSILLPKGKKDSLITGGLSEENGDFNVTELGFGRYKVNISYVGYKDYSQIVVVRPPDNVEIDLGNIRLELDQKVLAEVQISADKAQSQLSLDKQTFNVGKNAAAAGGTAEDVLKAVPSVSLDSDGNAKLRNNNTTIYLDGRPSPFTLNQIPADQIEKVEIITNPSAKYEAQSSGGIINIITKKNRKPGYNGFVNLGVGTGERFNYTASLSYKQGKYNLTAFANRNQSNNLSTGFTNRTNLLRNSQNVLNYFDQVNNSYHGHHFQLARLSLDYAVNNRNTLTFGANYHNGAFNVQDNQQFAFRSINRDTLSRGVRSIRPANEFHNLGGQLTWKKAYPKKGKELISDLSYNYGISENYSIWNTSEKFYNNAKTVTNKNEITGGNFSNQVVLQIDYTNPINDSTKIETGIRSYYNNREQEFFNDFIDADGNKSRINDFSQNFNVTDQINAAYVTYTGRTKQRINYQFGVRYEQSNLNGNSLIADKKDFGYNYPSSKTDVLKAMFPSAFFSKKLAKNQELQLNATRKIRRPDWRNIMPIIMMADRQNVTIGNPSLKPEFINLMELNYNKLFKANNLLISGYARNEQQPILQYSSPSASDSSVLVNSFINGKSSWRVGLDNTLKLELSKRVEWTMNANLFQQRFITQDIERQGFAYNLKSNLNLKFPKNISLQATGVYESPRVILQGEERSNYFMDLSLRKDITLADIKPSKYPSSANAPKLGSISFTVSDVFDTKRNLRFIEQPTFTQDFQRRREVRYFRVNLQVFFGKPDASIFKRRAQQNRQEGGQSMDF